MSRILPFEASPMCVSAISPFFITTSVGMLMTENCKVNVDEAPRLAEQFSVMSIPTLIVMKNGEIADTHIGLASKGKILDMLEGAE